MYYILGVLNLDTFFEQIIPIRKGFGQIIAIIGIWLASLLISAAVILFVFGGIISPMTIAVIVAFCYLAYYLSSKFSIEYEYIITNNSFDIDKIVAKKNRKRMASFELSQVEAIEKYNKNSRSNTRYSEVLKVCNDGDDVYELIVKCDSGAPMKVIFAPNDRMKTAIVKFVPRYISNSAFK